MAEKFIARRLKIVKTGRDRNMEILAWKQVTPRQGGPCGFLCGRSIFEDDHYG
jgi:hypothetical protein